MPTTSGKPFCEISSEDVRSSNLQLFSLRQVFRHWTELQAAKAGLSEAEIRERLVFVIVCAGTSISQLLGQNAAHCIHGTHVKSPKILFEKVFDPNHFARAKLEEFIDVYDDCRYFGSPKHASISGLTERKVEDFLNLVVQLWDETVRNYARESAEAEQMLVDFTTVRLLMSGE